MGNEHSVPVDRRAVKEAVRACAISELSRALTKEKAPLAGMSREDAVTLMDRIVPFSGTETRMPKPTLDGAEEPTQSGFSPQGVSRQNKVAMVAEMLGSGHIPTENAGGENIPAQIPLPCALTMEEPWHPARQATEGNASLGIIDYSAQVSNGKTGASSEPKEYIVDSVHVIQAERVSQHQPSIDILSGEGPSNDCDRRMEMPTSGVFAQDVATIDEKTHMSAVAVKKELESNRGIVDAADTDEIWRDVPGDEGTETAIPDHATPLMLGDHESDTEADERRREDLRSQLKVEPLGVPDFIFQNVKQLHRVLGYRGTGPSSDTDILSLREDLCRTILKYGDKNLQDHLSLLLGSFMVERANFQNDPDLMREGELLLERYSSFAASNDVDAVTHLMLGLGYGKLYRATEDSNHIDRAFRHRGLGILAVKSPLTHLTAARFWLRDELEAKISFNGFELLEIIIDSTTQPAGLKASAGRRHKLLRRLPWEVLARSTLAVDKELEKGSESVERVRGHLWNELSGLLTQPDETCSDDPTISDSRGFTPQHLKITGSLLSLLEEQLSETDGQGIRFKREDTHVQPASKLANKIRTTVPKLEHFLRSSSSTEWKGQSPCTHVDVMIIASKYQCDAMILFANSKTPCKIPLPEFSFCKAEQLQSLLRSSLAESQLVQREGADRLDEVEGRAARPATKRSPPHVLSSILRELWLLVVKPILTVLGFSRSENPEARIWWCATGPLMSLPLHAAGIYEGTHPESIFDYAISSYIPTISLLTERVKRSAQVIPEGDTGICLVSQAAAPGLPFIPGTRDEVARVAAIFNHEPDITVLRLEDGEATKTAALSAVRSHGWIHLACHGSQNPKEPLKSSFALADGRLELSTIIKNNSKDAEFAFLSACQTSTGDITLSEESVHLAAGMLVAGYRGVVGTMWSINDRHAPGVAEDFYRELLARSVDVGGKKRLVGEQAACALHYAVQRLRKRVGDSNYLVWVPYVHFGV